MPITTETVAMPVITTMRITCTGAECGTSAICEMPVLICIAPRPSEVATPNNVPTVHRISTICPIQPSMRFPMIGNNNDRGTSGSLCLEHPFENPGTLHSGSPSG